ncbi:MAG: L,D-transpeptidase family protein [Tabrizicola sp.]|uniref:L,D-transpeptidase family protein n=1 Tax=Tabrizicola sp. TaxID=2005166 RepID=UPI002735652B|nr:L,D-transpeptidase family protein [Tabrizicola sp.]MDP3262655.1 L,D-transpeptidase family protein [Tabrizicola sp.]MDP3647815.1 L,D-transpeptidase family protein [Paracoccaceae bacterium]MDZ4069271.1 L,D-transpeptidase family protein [Tabrizicola sp.]
MRRLFALLLLTAALGLALAAAWMQPMPPAPPVPPQPIIGQIDHILIEKSARRMQLFQNGQPVRSYRIALGFSPAGDKTRQGDGRTPEGHFRIDRRNAASAYHLSLGLDYPHPADRARAAASGTDPGGDIFIHGQPNALPDGFRAKGDWTAGCIAVTNAEMREIWAATPTGTTVEIRP